MNPSRATKKASDDYGQVNGGVFCDADYGTDFITPSFKCYDDKDKYKFKKYSLEDFICQSSYNAFRDNYFADLYNLIVKENPKLKDKAQKIARERISKTQKECQKSEQREVEEFFAKGQKGSSAMPHKRNPIGSENMTGLARVIRGHMVTAYENVALWHERDISHSSAERIIAPDTTILIDYMLNRFGNIVKNLTVFPENMIRNMNSTFGLIFSQRAMLTLIEKGMTREQAYDLVQPKTAQSWDNQVDFKPLLESDPEVTSRLTQEEIDEIFNPVYYTKRVDEIFERIGLGD